MDNEQNERECKQIGDTSYTFLSDWVYHKEGVRKGCEQVFAKANDEEFVIWRNLQEEAYQRLKAEIDFYEEWKEKDRDALEHGLENIDGCLVDDEKKVCYLVTKRKEKRKTLKDRGLMCEKDVEAFFRCLKYVLKLGGAIQEDPEAYFCDGESWRARGVVGGKNLPSKLRKIVDCVQGRRHDKKKIINELKASNGSDELDESKLNKIEEKCLKIVSRSPNGEWRKIMLAIAIILLVFASYFAIGEYEARQQKKRCDVNREIQNYISGKMYQKASEVLESDDRVYVSKENRDKLAREWCEHICEMYVSDKPDKEGHEKWVKLFAEQHKDLARRMGEKCSEYEEGENRARVNVLFRRFREEERYLEAAGILEGKDGNLVQADEGKKLAQQWGEWIMNNLCREDVRKQHLPRWGKNFGKSEQQFTEKLREEYGTVEDIMREVKDEHYNSASRRIKDLKCLKNKQDLIDELLPKWREAINQKLTQGELTDDLPKYVGFIKDLKGEHILPSGHRSDNINLHDLAKETLRRVFSIKKRVEISTYLEVYDKAFPEQSLELDEETFMAAPPEIRDLLSERADVKSWLDNITPRIASDLEIGKSGNKKLAMWLARSDEQRRKDFSKALLKRVDSCVKTWKDKLNGKTENDPKELYKQMLEDVGQFIAPLGLKGVMDSAKNCLDAWVKKDERWREYRYIWEEKAKEVGWLKEDGTMFEEEDRTIYYLSVKMIRKNRQKDAPKYEATIKHSSMNLENKEKTVELEVEDKESEPFWCDLGGRSSTIIEWYLLKPGSWKKGWVSEKEQKGKKKLLGEEVRSAMKEPIKLDEEITIQFIEKKP